MAIFPSPARGRGLRGLSSLAAALLVIALLASTGRAARMARPKAQALTHLRRRRAPWYAVFVSLRAREHHT